MVNTIEQIESWLFEYGLTALTIQEALFLQTKPEEVEICDCLGFFVSILNSRGAGDDCFNYPDLSKIKDDNSCSIDLPLPTDRRFILGVFV